MINQLENAIYLENLAKVKEILQKDPKAIHTEDEHGVAMAFLATR